MSNKTKALLIALIVILSGCFDHGWGRWAGACGVITDKQYERRCSKGCYWHYYFLVVGTDANGQHINGWVDVGADLYARREVGADVCFASNE